MEIGKEVLKGLCQWEHRLTTSENEKKASEYLKQGLEKLGYLSEIEEFNSPATFSWTYLVIYLGLALSFILFFFFPKASIAFFLISLILFLGEQTTLFAPLTLFIFARGKSQNLIGRIPPPPDDAKKRLWLVAHYDSSKASLAFSPGSVRFLRPLFIFSLVLLATGFIILFLGYGNKLEESLWVRVFLIFAGVYFFYMAMMMVERELRGMGVQGASDNASGVAVVMELAQRLKEKPLINSELKILLTGAEEVGMVGMQNFIKRHKRELSPKIDYFINFDSIGEGEPCWITKEGMLKPFRVSEKLSQIAFELSQKQKFQAIKAKAYTTLTLDTLVARARNFETLSFMALTKQGFPKPWHWFDDTIEKVELDKLALVSDFAEALLRNFDQNPI